MGTGRQQYLRSGQGMKLQMQLLCQIKGFDEKAMQTYWNEILPSLESLGVWGYWLIGLLTFGEAFILTSVFAPGTIVVVLGGALAARGIYDVGDLIWFAATGTILGAQASFTIGSKGAEIFQEGRRVFNPAHLERGKRFFARYGAPSIILGHFLGPLRPIIPVVAGLSDMSRRRFLVWNVIGGIAYSIISISIGYFFGTAVHVVSGKATQAGLIAIGILLALGLLWFFATRLRRALPLSRLSSDMRWVKDNPMVRRMVAHHPGFFAFMSTRLSREPFTGLPLTLMVVAVAYFLLLYVGHVVDHSTQSQIVALDVRFAELLFAVRDPGLVQLFTYVTAFGYWQIVTTLAATVSALMWLLNRPHYLPGLWMTLACNQLTVTMLKNIFISSFICGDAFLSYPFSSIIVQGISSSNRD